MEKKRREYRLERLKTWVIVFLVGVFVTACSGKSIGLGGVGSVGNAASGPYGGDFALNNQKRLFANSARAVGWKQPRYSQEIANHLKRNMIYNNPNHKSYVYIYANNGAIKAYFPVVGKCSATESSPTSLTHATDQAGNSDTSNNEWLGNSGTSNGAAAGATVDSPQLDGSYGGNEPGIFCFVDKPGHPMITFNGDYIMSDQYMKLDQAPELIVDQNRDGTGHK